jgi:hypothetical protein
VLQQISLNAAIYEECNTIDCVLEMEAVTSSYNFDGSAGNKTRFCYLCHEHGYPHTAEEQAQAAGALQDAAISLRE